jgi:hypothetical protein
MAALAAVVLASAVTAEEAAKEAPKEAAKPAFKPFEIPVVVVKYFPVKGDALDKSVTGDCGEPLKAMRERTDRTTGEIIASLQEGSRYHGYKSFGAAPSLHYTILKTYEFLKPLPTCELRAGEKVPVTDYNKIVEDIGIKEWVEEKGVKEVWIWGYHGGVVTLWESNMAGPYGDVSNSNRDPKDLPIFSKTYTVYHYNYTRGTSEAVEDHMHQIEHVVNWADGRDRTPPDEWGKLLFWGKFVGSDKSHKIITPHCGWTHYPPNGEKDYDWGNKRVVQSDIEDWKPDGSGQKQPINCDKWDSNSLHWFIYWMQNLPGADNGLTYEGKALRNWWIFIGDFDTAMKEKMKLWVE